MHVVLSRRPASAHMLWANSPYAGCVHLLEGIVPHPTDFTTITDSFARLVQSHSRPTRPCTIAALPHGPC